MTGEFKEVPLFPPFIATGIRPFVKITSAVTDGLIIYLDTLATAYEILGFILSLGKLPNLFDASFIVEQLEGLIRSIVDTEVWRGHFFPISNVGNSFDPQEVQNWGELKENIVCATEASLTADDYPVAGLLFVNAAPNVFDVIPLFQALGDFSGYVSEMEGLRFIDQPQTLDRTCQRVPPLTKLPFGLHLPIGGLIDKALSFSAAAVQVGKTLANAALIGARLIREKADLLRQVAATLDEIEQFLEGIGAASVLIAPVFGETGIGITSPEDMRTCLNSLENAPDDDFLAGGYILLGSVTDLRILQTILVATL